MDDGGGRCVSTCIQYLVAAGALTANVGNLSNISLAATHPRPSHIMFLALSKFYIELKYYGGWTDAQKAVYQSAADR